MATIDDIPANLAAPAPGDKLLVRDVSAVSGDRDKYLLLSQIALAGLSNDFTGEQTFDDFINANAGIYTYYNVGSVGGAERLKILFTRAAPTVQFYGVMLFVYMMGRVGTQTYSGAKLLAVNDRYNSSMQHTNNDLLPGLSMVETGSTGTALDLKFSLGGTGFAAMHTGFLVLGIKHGNIDIAGSMVA